MGSGLLCNKESDYEEFFCQKNGIMMLAAVTVVAVAAVCGLALSSQTGFLQNAGASLPPPSGR